MDTRSRREGLKSALRTGAYLTPAVAAVGAPMTRVAAVTAPATMVVLPVGASPTPTIGVFPAGASPTPMSAAPTATSRPTATPLPTATPIPVTKIGMVQFTGHPDAVIPYQNALEWQITGFTPFTYFYRIILNPRTTPNPVYSYKRIGTANHGDAAELLNPSTHPILGSGTPGTYMLVFTTTDPGTSSPTNPFPNELLRATFTMTGKGPQPPLSPLSTQGTHEA